MNQAERLLARIAEIDEELEDNPQSPGFGNTTAWLFSSMTEERRATLVEERRRLTREYDRLPADQKRDRDA